MVTTGQDDSKNEKELDKFIKERFATVYGLSTATSYDKWNLYI